MITGSVTPERKPSLPLRVRGPFGTILDVAAVVDTGFTGFMTLPEATVSALSLAPSFPIGHQLADGSELMVDMFDVEVEWGVGWRSVPVAAIGPESLVGMKLLEGHRLYMEVITGGLVDIIALP